MTKYVLALLCLTVLTSCLKEEEVKNDDGAEASTSAVGSAVSRAWGNDDPLGIKYGEKVSVNSTAEYLGYPNVRLTQQEAFTSMDKKPVKDDQGNDYTIFQLAQRLNQIDSDNNDHITTQMKNFTVRNYDADSSEVQTKGTEAIVGYYKVLALLFSCQLPEDTEKYCHDNGYECSQKCYNVQTSEEVRAVPAAVAARPNCGGVPGCVMNLKKLSFDIIIQMKKGSTTQKQKVTRSIAVFQDAPYLSKLIDNCYRGLVNIPNSSNKVLATLCDHVVDFQYGSGSYPAATETPSN
jgi:hypothetical protein